MRLFNFLLLWSSMLFTHVLANNEAVPYELLHFYYVYKIEWDSGVDKTIAVGCAAEYGHMCYFDEFAKFLIADKWRNAYRPSAADHTLTPDTSAVTRLLSGIPKSARYKLGMLLPYITVEDKSYPRVFEEVLRAANHALDKGDVDKDDLQQALAMAQKAIAARSQDVFRIQQDSLLNRIGAATNKFVHVTASGFLWYDTLRAIDQAVRDRKLTSVEGNRAKETIRQFSLTYQHDILHGDPSNIVRSLATSITSMTRAIEERFPSSDASSPRAPSPECADEFFFSSSPSSSESD
ncbi:uncharacterized protein ACLA_042590 [Aspergillus clavatus NRRL 1]|uniref:Uncharacterized protein n=1 Tax=Aspergillus clavatus (strain ATCC 1007 / CBS 513.65 / DSM 816 / NCTC 3887 / NRRL 1 / QM 1276 / 107) TaxID=344612 RepID=A1CLL2_ASPCL|nr:uncharacterized protein ACLA_042590 [Aspergillus clavatus NRRL 1]EAW10036.1 hypothetical protein protein [Aspergillus clavatus NRRL 1]